MVTKEVQGGVPDFYRHRSYGYLESLKVSSIIPGPCQPPNRARTPEIGRTKTTPHTPHGSSRSARGGEISARIAVYLTINHKAAK